MLQLMLAFNFNVYVVVGLAPVIRDEIWNAIGQLKRETALSILLIDKSVSELARVADRAVILERCGEPDLVYEPKPLLEEGKQASSERRRST